MEKPPHISRLLDRYINNTASPEEVRQLLAYFQEGSETEADVLELIRRHLEHPEGLTEPISPEIQQALSESLQKIRQRIHQHSPLAAERRVRRLPTKAIIAAASILLAFTVGIGWFYYMASDE